MFAYIWTLSSFPSRRGRQMKRTNERNPLSSETFFFSFFFSPPSSSSFSRSFTYVLIRLLLFSPSYAALLDLPRTKNFSTFSSSQEISFHPPQREKMRDIQRKTSMTAGWRLSRSPEYISSLLLQDKQIFFPPEA